MDQITIGHIDTPLGQMIAGVNSKGLCLLEFKNEDRINGHLKQFGENIEIIEDHSNALITITRKEIESYFNGNLNKFSIPLDLIGTDFQCNVWKELKNIDFGKTRTYLDQAKALGDVKAIRAVATANGKNRIAIVVPCHRVIGSDGSLTGYAGELWRKKKLLELESNQTRLF